MQTANSLETAQRSYDEATESATIQANRAASNVNSAYTTYTEAVATEASSKTAYQKASIQKKITKNQESLTLAKQTYETKSATLKEAQQDASTAKQAYEQAGNALEQAGSSYTKAVQEQISSCTVTAPISGVITETSMTRSSANEDSRDMSSIFGGTGGGRSGNMGSGGMSGGMPGGGGRP